MKVLQSNYPKEYQHGQEISSFDDGVQYVVGYFSSDASQRAAYNRSSTTNRGKRAPPDDGRLDEGHVRGDGQDDGTGGGRQGHARAKQADEPTHGAYVEGDASDVRSPEQAGNERARDAKADGSDAQANG